MAQQNCENDHTAQAVTTLREWERRAHRGTVTLDPEEISDLADLLSSPPSERRPVQLPTLPGKVDGIVGWDPVVLQCRDCGATYTGAGPRRNAGADIILSGYRFHTCERGTGMSKRRCPDCLELVESACPSRGRHQ